MKIYRYRNESPKLQKLCKIIKSMELKGMSKEIHFTHRVEADWHNKGYTYKLVARQDPCGNLDKRDKVMSISCQQCGQKCSLNILDGKEYESRAISAVRSKCKTMKLCPRQPWHRAPKEPNALPVGKAALYRALGITKNSRGGYKCPVPKIP